MSNPVDDAIRLTIARSIWDYYEYPERFGPYDGDDDGPAGELCRKVVTDEAELIRAGLAKDGWFDAPPDRPSLIRQVVVTIAVGAAISFSALVGTSALVALIIRTIDGH